MRYEYQVDSEDDCLTLTDNKDELKTSFDSEIMLFPADDACSIVDKLNWYELLVKEMRMHLEYHGWSDDEDLVHCLIAPHCRFHYHYKGYIVGGAFFFCEDKYASVDMVKMELQEK